MAARSSASDERISGVDQEVKALSDREYADLDLAFAHLAVSALLDLDDDEAYEACEVGLAGGDGPHAFYLDDDARRIILVVVRYAPEAKATLARNFALSLERAYARVLAPKTRGSRDKLGSVARTVAGLLEDDPDYPIEVWGVGFGVRKRAATNELSRIDDDAEDNVDYRLFDARRILDAVRERDSREAPAMADAITLTLRHHFEYGPSGQPGAIVANLDALELAKLEQRYGYRLFQRNVRYLLQGKQKINEDIQKTLQAPSERNNFWYYNNGIAILCDRFDPPKEAGGRTSLTVHNLQIVNGCQTTATLARTIEALEEADPPVQVLARIIAADDNSDLSDYIPLYNNRQNAVRERDLQSNDLVQSRLQTEFGKLSSPWFYVRKRGEWEARASKSRYGTRRIENDVAAQAYYAFFHDPGVARARKRYLFTRKREGGLYEDVFNKDTTPEALLLPFRLTQYIKPQVAKYRREIKDVRPGRGSAADQKKLAREWLKFGEQYLLGTIGWHLRRTGPLPQDVLRSLALDHFDELTKLAYPLAERDLTRVFRRVAATQPVIEGDANGRREPVDYANYVKGHWSDVVDELSLEYEIVRDEELPLASFMSSVR